MTWCLCQLNSPPRHNWRGISDSIPDGETSSAEVNRTNRVVFSISVRNERNWICVWNIWELIHISAHSATVVCWFQSTPIWIQYCPGQILWFVFFLFELVEPVQTIWCDVFSPQKITFLQQWFSSLFFSIRVAVSGKNRLSKLHYRFQRYTKLIKTVQRKSQCLQSYDGQDGLLQNLAWKFQEYHHNFAA